MGCTQRCKKFLPETVPTTNLSGKPPQYTISLQRGTATKWRFCALQGGCIVLFCEIVILEPLQHTHIRRRLRACSHNTLSHTLITTRDEQVDHAQHLVAHGCFRFSGSLVYASQL